MSGIGNETAFFICACLTGIVVAFLYQIIRVFRKIVKHSVFFTNLEDFLYWILMSAYIFYQLYKTTYGSVRLFFALGIVFGWILGRMVVCGVDKVGGKVKKILEKSVKSE